MILMSKSFKNRIVSVSRSGQLTFDRMQFCLKIKLQKSIAFLDAQETANNLALTTLLRPWYLWSLLRHRLVTSRISVQDVDIPWTKQV